jgi:hypothetical protein
MGAPFILFNFYSVFVRFNFVGFNATNILNCYFAATSRRPNMLWVGSKLGQTIAFKVGEDARWTKRHDGGCGNQNSERHEKRQGAGG